MTAHALASLALVGFGGTLAKHSVIGVGWVRRWPPERTACAAGHADSLGFGVGLAVWLATHLL